MDAGTDRIVAVVGATGFTGGLVIDALGRRGVKPRLVGRDEGRLRGVAERAGGLAFVAVPGWDEKGLSRALHGCAAVISCAGPFVAAGWPVAAAAVAEKVPYADSTGEQVFIRRVFETLDGPARDAGVPLVPAFGFDYVPGSLGAAIAAEGFGPIERIDVVYATKGGGTSVGTRRSAIEAAAAGGVSFVDGQPVAERLGAHVTEVTTGFGPRTAGSFPAGEPITVPRHIDVRTVVAYMALRSTFGVRARALDAAVRFPAAKNLLVRLAERGAAAPSEATRDVPWECHVHAVARDGRERRVVLSGRDPYGFTGEALADLALRMAAGEVSARGACAPAQVVDARAFCARLGVAIRDG